MPDQPIPIGLCQCGCGEPTTIAKYKDRHKGWGRGQPKRYLPHHYRRLNVKWLPEDRGYTTPCHVWQGGTNPQGYGYGDASSRDAAHRQAWVNAHGPIPPETPHVLHRCDQPPCVNVEHLFLGTQEDNMADCVAKGRHACGERNHWAKLTSEEVVAIRAATGITQRDLATAYGVTVGLISMIRRGKIWKSV